MTARPRASVPAPASRRQCSRARWGGCREVEPAAASSTANRTWSPSPAGAGYLRAMGDAGLPPDVINVGGPDYTEEAGAQAGRMLLRRETLPTAVVACNDQVAVGLLQVLARAGVAVPGEVSLTGFDDSRFASLSSVDLTTVRQDPVEMGRAAVGAAVRRIGNPAAKPALHVLRLTLVIRGGTSPPS